MSSLKVLVHGITCGVPNFAVRLEGNSEMVEFVPSHLDRLPVVVASAVLAFDLVAFHRALRAVDRVAYVVDFAAISDDRL